MKKIFTLIIFIIFLIACTGCKKNKNLDLEELYEKNGELAFDHFLGWGTDELKYESIIFEPEKANRFEIISFSPFFSEGVEKILYLKYENVDMLPIIVAIQYESAELAQEFCTSNSPRVIRNDNIVAYQMSGSYMLLYGEYKEIDGYWLSSDCKVLLSDNQRSERVEMVLPEGVKLVPGFSIFSNTIKSVKCNSDLEILYVSALAFLPSLEKIELNDGLKEIYANCFFYHNLEYLVIPKSVEKIEAQAFQNVTIYCEVEEKPVGWDKDFAENNCEVYWKGTWEYVDGIPQPIANEEVA